MTKKKKTVFHIHVAGITVGKVGVRRPVIMQVAMDFSLGSRPLQLQPVQPTLIGCPPSGGRLFCFASPGSFTSLTVLMYLW
jgi:hypothetical protein